MSIQITYLGPKPGNPGDGIDRLPSRAATVKIHGGSAVPADEEKGTVIEIHFGLGRFTAANERLNALAGEARTAGQRMEAMSEAVNRMKTTLEAITKNFPPFPPGSEDRVKLLKSYAVLRKQIADLTVPPEQEKSTAGRSEASREQSQYTFVLQNDGMVRTVPREEVRVGPSGLVIPEVQNSSSDRDIHQAVEALANTARTLDEQRAHVTQEITSGAAADQIAWKAHAAGAATGNGFDTVPDESEVQRVSQSVRDALARMGGGFLHTGELRSAIQGA